MTILPNTKTSVRRFATAAGIFALALSTSWIVASQSLPALSIDETYGNIPADLATVSAVPALPMAGDAIPAQTVATAQASVSMPLEKAAGLLVLLAMALGPIFASGWRQSSK